MRIVGQAYDSAKLTEDEAQRVNDTPGLAKLLGDFIAGSRVTDRYINQQVDSAWTYPSEYTGQKGLEEQVKTLADCLPGLGEPNWSWYNDLYPKFDSPDWVEGVFAVPSEFALQRNFHPSTTDRAAAYCASISLLMGKIADSRPFYNYREGQITPAYLWRTERTVEMLDALWKLQGQPDIIVLPAQLGMRHRGRSILRARECFVGNEFGAGSLEALAITLTHPERFVRWEQLHEDMAGDDFSAEADDQADGAPVLYFFDGEVKFNAHWTDDANERYGAVSCWLPPQ
jgi:hypothetical protein